MKTISVNLYELSELSDKAKQKAISNLSDINVSHDWWDCTYDDAENIGLKITSFDLDRNRGAKGKFITSGSEVAEKIMQEHGESCETFKTAEQFLSDWANLVIKYSDGKNMDRVAEGNEYDFDNEADDLEAEFLNSLLEDYSIMLQKESEYLQSDAAIIETINANDYVFYSDGELAHATTYTGNHEKAGITEVKAHGETFEI